LAYLFLSVLNFFYILNISTVACSLVKSCGMV
jgi:hypothetical protein